MVQELSFSNFNVDEKGRVTVSGLASGIDTRSAIESILAARRVPIDRIEQRVAASEDRVVELNKLRGLIGTLNEKVGLLRGAISFERDTDIFESKGFNISPRRADDRVPTPATEVFGFAVTNRANVGSHRIEILQVASSHKVASLQGITVQGANQLGIEGQFRLKLGDDPFDASDNEITIKASDSIFDIRDAINAVNRGNGAAGVTASIVTVRSQTDNNGNTQPIEVLLNLTADRTGQHIQFEHVSGDEVLQRLNLVNSGGFINVLKEPQVAQIRVDGQVDGRAGFQSTGFDQATDVIGGGTLSIQTTDGTQTLSVAVPSGASLAQAASSLDGQNFSGGGAVLRAQISEIGGKQVLTFYAEESGEKLAIEVDGAAASGPGQIWRTGSFGRPALVVERDTNTVSDLIEGVTFNLFRSEPGTNYDISIESDRVTIKQGILDFVEAYNEVRRYLNGQRQTNPATGQPVEGAVLYGETILSNLETELSTLISLGVLGASDNDFRGIGQETLGLRYTVLSNADLDSNGERALERGTLTVDENKLNESLLNDLSRVRRLFSHSIQSNDSRVVIVGAGAKVSPLGENGLTITVVSDGTGIDEAASSISAGSFRVDGSDRIVVTDGPGAGLTFFYRGDLTDTTPVQATITNTIGVAHQISRSLDRILADRTGLIDTELETIEDHNQRARADIVSRLRDLDIYRSLLVERFERLEATIAKFSALREQLLQVFNSGNQS